MHCSQIYQSGNWIAAATTASADAQLLPTSKLLPLVALLSVGYVIASLCLTSLLGSPEDDIFFVEDIAMFAMLLVCWLLAQPLFARHTKKLGVSAKQSSFEQEEEEEEVDARQTSEAAPSSSRGSSAFRLRRAQRRRQLRCGFDQLREVQRSLSDDTDSATGSGQAKRFSATLATVHNFHMPARSAGLLLPAEVAVCHFPPEVCEHVRRQLEDRWAVVDNVGAEKWLPSIPE